MRLHLVSRISVLEKADPETPVNNEVKLDPKTLAYYEVERF
jgi:hypothetical protein